jgi:acyl carrier protein
MGRTETIVDRKRRKSMVPTQFTFNDLKSILVNRIGLPSAQIVNDPDLSFEDLGLDSLALVEIQLEVQQRYGFSIPDKDSQQIVAIGQAITYINSRLQEQE